MEDVPDEVGNWYELVPIKATPLRVGLAVLGFITEVTQAIANLSGAITVITYQHQKYKAVNEEFEGIVNNFDNPSSIGPWSPESED